MPDRTQALPQMQRDRILDYAIVVASETTTVPDVTVADVYGYCLVYAEVPFS